MDPYTVRLKDTTNPERDADFDVALEVGRAHQAQVLRGLADAYIAYVAEHGRVPSFPVRIVSADEDPKLHEQSPLYRTRKTGGPSLPQK